MPAGTSKFDRTNPVTPDDYTSIPTAVNDVVTQLAGALGADNYGNQGGTSTDIALVDASSLPNAGWFCCGKEIISYTNKSSNTLNGCVRGAQSTTIAAHGNRAPVVYNFTAAHLNVIISAIIALETLFTNFKTEQGTTGGGATITMGGTPITGKKVLLFVNGVFYTDGTDFNVSGTILTYTGSIYPPAGLPYTAVYYAQ